MNKQKELIAIAIGQASMCWEFPERAGKFQDREAINILETLIKKLDNRLDDGTIYDLLAKKLELTEDELIPNRWYNKDKTRCFTLGQYGFVPDLNFKI